MRLRMRLNLARLGAHAGLRRAATGLAITAPVLALISFLGGTGLGWSLVPLLAFWLAGVLLRARRQAASLAARNAALQRQAEQAAAVERTRVARELHDIVAHHLSVVVLQAAGARASGKAAGGGSGEDREQRTAGAGRNPSAAGRLARAA